MPKKQEPDPRNVVGFTLKLDETQTERFLKVLNDEGLMRAGFVIHESNNANVTIELKPNCPEESK
jgi:hypothetical protein